ncbi:MAG: hypothetical protein LBH45_04755, partial [Campylobacteraceae bacterium]|nr:hypothetical protein [Campylobacteraceae bacterium]
YDLGGRLVKQSNGLEFYYDGNGLNGFKYNGAQYIYRKNAQGDITHILDISGNIVVRYSYDAWGNHTITDTSGASLGSLNPFMCKLRNIKTLNKCIKTQQKQYINDRILNDSRDQLSFYIADLHSG